MAMTKAQQKVVALALEVAAFPPPPTPGMIQARHGIPRQLIADLRNALEDAGVDWRQFRADERRAGR